MESFNVDSLCPGDSDDTDIEEEDEEEVDDNDEGIEKEVLEVDDFDADPSEIRVRLLVC